MTELLSSSRNSPTERIFHRECLRHVSCGTSSGGLRMSRRQQPVPAANTGSEGNTPWEFSVTPSSGALCLSRRDKSTLCTGHRFVLCCCVLRSADRTRVVDTELQMQVKFLSRNIFLTEEQIYIYQRFQWRGFCFVFHKKGWCEYWTWAFLLWFFLKQCLCWEFAKFFQHSNL